MVTVYGARSTAEPMIARVRRMHDRIAGTTPSGEVYHANDPHLLNWVQGTAAYGFLQAYHTYVRPLSLEERNRYYTEGALAARLYGATGAPASEVELESLFRVMRDRLERSGIVFEFLAIIRHAPVLPLLLRPVQHLLVRAAVDLTPHWARRSWDSAGTLCVRGKPKRSGRQEPTPTASFCYPVRRSRPVNGCTFRPIISMLITATEAEGHRLGPRRRQGRTDHKLAVIHKIGTAGASSPTTFSTVLPITLRGSPANLALQLEEGPIVWGRCRIPQRELLGSDRLS